MPALADLNDEQLRRVMDDRLHGSASIGPALDRREGPMPFQWLAEEFGRADAPLKDRMLAVIHEFLGQLPDPIRWPGEPEDNLLALAQVPRSPETSNRIREVLRSGHFSGEGAFQTRRTHAGLIKTLVAIGCQAAPDFWRQQLKALGRSSAAMIFKAMLPHGLAEAAALLPEISGDQLATDRLIAYLPALYNRSGCGKERVGEVFRRYFDAGLLSEYGRQRLDAEFGWSEEDSGFFSFHELPRRLEHAPNRGHKLAGAIDASFPVEQFPNRDFLLMQIADQAKWPEWAVTSLPSLAFQKAEDEWFLWKPYDAITRIVDTGAILCIVGSWCDGRIELARIDAKRFGKGVQIIEALEPTRRADKGYGAKVQMSEMSRQLQGSMFQVLFTTSVMRDEVRTSLLKEAGLPCR